jgi:hypothetical protein
MRLTASAIGRYSERATSSTDSPNSILTSRMARSNSLLDIALRAAALRWLEEAVSRATGRASYELLSDRILIHVEWIFAFSCRTSNTRRFARIFGARLVCPQMTEAQMPLGGTGVCSTHHIGSSGTDGPDDEPLSRSNDAGERRLSGQAIEGVVVFVVPPGGGNSSSLATTSRGPWQRSEPHLDLLQARQVVE